MPLPKFTDEDMKAAEREYSEKEPKAARRTTDGKKHRSLHYIDDEEYEDVTEKTENKSEETKEIEAPVVEEEKSEKNSLLSQAPLKEDAPREKKKDKAENEDNK